MNWKRLGYIFCSRGQFDWMQTHAANPVAEHLEKDLFRVYFNCRDRNNRSSVGFIVIDLNRSAEILELSSYPVLSPGGVGLFDDAGVSLGCIIECGGRNLLYYTGWSLAVSVPWINEIGVAWSSATGPPKFERYSPAPIVHRSRLDPFSMSYPWVLRDDDGFRMWYGSNLAPTPRDRVIVPHAIHQASSQDGIHWQKLPQQAIGSTESEYCSFARPCVIRDPGGYHMWYSFRGTHYQIGYARSQDGVHWDRQDASGGLEPGDAAWESDATCYSCVFDHGGQRFMLYNGNHYGRTGFGLAIAS